MRPPFVPVARPPVRKVLSIAIGYDKHESAGLKLPGTHKDPKILRELLKKHFHYKDQDFTILMDDGRHECPTRANIVRSFFREFTVSSTNISYDRGDSRLIITVSGHGDQIPNLNGAEKDGYDEGRKLTSLFNFLESPHHPTVIFPVDINYTGPGDFDNYIMDDEIHDILVDHVPRGAHFVMIFDCCHSGTMADLPFSEEEDAWQSPADRRLAQSVRFHGSHAGGRPTRIVPESWSACRDAELAQCNGQGGLFMRSCSPIAEAHDHATHEELLHAITQEMARIIAKSYRKRHALIPEEMIRPQNPEYDCDIPIEQIRDTPVQL
ncbi:hypothetical protein IEO21_03987 [Rhodonia placenta]|uniref:Peptidase C14 caspase domain-containing protein n=1 Tax=Rhodonia placenta TaxID=104341 RepID=A0A8H7P4Q2_9APHY|nr:hypothetical protein IEO21_03987 [Postia placenta]